jgi:aminomethyltransferase
VSDANLLTTPLNALHMELGARMVPFALYSMPVQYPAGLMQEHAHTRNAAGLFDVSHMGQLVLRGQGAAAAFESLIPMDVIDLPAGKQRYGLLLNETGGIMDDLMFIKRSSQPASSMPNSSDEEIFVIVNGACKAGDIAHMRQHIGSRCEIVTMPTQGLLALQGPQAVTALSRLIPGVEKLVFMTGAWFNWQGAELFITRSGYTGEDGCEISVPEADTDRLARALLALPEVKPVGLGARNSLRLEAGLCLYGNDIDSTTDPIEAALTWAIQKVRRAGGARAGGFPGATKIIAYEVMNTPASDSNGLKISKKRIGLIAQERIPVRDGTELVSVDGAPIGKVTSGLLGPTINQPIAMGYVRAEFTAIDTVVHAMVRGKPVAMKVCTMPFVAQRYYRGSTDLPRN